MWVMTAFQICSMLTGECVILSDDLSPYSTKLECAEWQDYMIGLIVDNFFVNPVLPGMLVLTGGQCTMLPVVGLNELKFKLGVDKSVIGS